MNRLLNVTSCYEVPSKGNRPTQEILDSNQHSEGEVKLAILSIQLDIALPLISLVGFLLYL